MKKLLYVPESRTYIQLSNVSAVVVDESGNYALMTPGALCKVALTSLAHEEVRKWLEDGATSRPSLLSFPGLRAE